MTSQSINQSQAQFSSFTVKKTRIAVSDLVNRAGEIIAMNASCQ